MGAQGEIQPSSPQAILTAQKTEREKQAHTASSGEQSVPHPQPPFPRQRKIARQSRHRRAVRGYVLSVGKTTCRKGRHNRTAQSRESNAVGAAYEQYPQPCNGDCKYRVDLQLTNTAVKWDFLLLGGAFLLLYFLIRDRIKLIWQRRVVHYDDFY